MFVFESLLAVLSLAVYIVPSHCEVFNVQEFGALPNGTLCTQAVAAAIEAAGNSYAQTHQQAYVEFPCCGVYLFGAVQLPSGVILRLKRGAIARASPNQADYPSSQDDWVFIRSRGASNIGVVGEGAALLFGGVLDGNALPGYDGGYDAATTKYLPRTFSGCSGECRPRTIQFRDSSNILLGDGVTIANSPDWTTHLLRCNNVTMRFATVAGDIRWPNNDAVDIDGTTNMVLRDSYLSTGDDGVCFKTSTPNYPVVNITVQRCTVRSKSCAVKFGSSTTADFKDIVVEDIIVWDSHRALGIQARDQGNVGPNITFRNIRAAPMGVRWASPTWWGAGEGIWITSVHRARGSLLGSVSGIQFINVTIESEGCGVFVDGTYGNAITDIKFQDVAVTVSHWSNWTVPVHDWRPGYVPGVPGQQKVGPIYPWYLRRSSDVAFSGCSGTWNRSLSWSPGCFSADGVPHSGAVRCRSVQ